MLFRLATTTEVECKSAFLRLFAAVAPSAWLAESDMHRERGCAAQQCAYIQKPRDAGRTKKDRRWGTKQSAQRQIHIKIIINQVAKKVNIIWKVVSVKCRFLENAALSKRRKMQKEGWLCRSTKKGVQKEQELAFENKETLFVENS